VRSDEGPKAAVFLVEETFEFGGVDVGLPLVGGGGEVAGSGGEEGGEFVDVGLGREEAVGGGRGERG